MSNDEYKQLIGFLEKKFTKIDDKFDQIDKRFDKVDEEFVKVRQELGQKIEEKFEENKRYFGVLAEGLRGEIRIVAEGHGVLQRQIDDLCVQVDKNTKEVISFRADNENKHKEIVSLLNSSYTGLDQRVTVLEAKVK